MLVFLQSWRSTLIPLTAVPVAIIGTFAVMAVMGFSLNNLTLFGLVLAIGIVVDDAIVVVEAVEHHIEEGMTPKQAAIKAMERGVRPGHRRGAGAVGGVRAVRLHHGHHRPVLPPVRADHRRLDGHLGAQLADAQPGPGGPLPEAARGPSATWIGLGLHFLLGWFFWLFNFAFRRTTNGYTRAVGMLLRLSVLVLVVYAAMLGLTYWGFNQMPTGYIPTQDKGYLLVSLQLPDATALERTKEVRGPGRCDSATTEKGVAHSIAIAGTSFSPQRQRPQLRPVLPAVEAL